MTHEHKRFRAFISYSQKDKAHTRRLHKALEAYRIPRGINVTGIDPKTRRIGRFFRDDDEMGAVSHLGDALRGAIADSENLIVVCSPEAAQSKWVNEEVLHFKRTGRAENIFAVIVNGMPNTGDPETECFPPALRFHVDDAGNLTDVPVEPLGLDLRKEPSASLRARLVAGLLRLNFDDLWRRDRRRARAARRWTVALASATIVIVATVVFSVFGVGQKDLEESRALSLSLLLARPPLMTKTTKAPFAFRSCQHGRVGRQARLIAGTVFWLIYWRSFLRVGCPSSTVPCSARVSGAS